ncbi:MAG: RNA polymerase sigma-70 factor [Prolixibacteraceae bacterium]|jgi:RNA polymerase sigma-70 factor (ECF subfamily)|nr:RNA polymerase sigma-70 factor [Prolixibacteraceae bacterium]
MEIPDSTLILRIAKNDYSSYKHLFMRYYSRLCVFVFHITCDMDMAEDIVQEFYMKLWTDRNKIKIKGNVRSYLFTSCRNAALNSIRDEKLKIKNLEMIGRDQLPEEEITEQEDYLNALERCIALLPERSKQVLQMFKLEGFSQKEISEKLNISVKTIKNQVWKSLQFLRSCLNTKNSYLSIFL